MVLKYYLLYDKSGVNYQDNKIYNGLTADDIVKIIQNRPQPNVQSIYNEMVKKFEEIDKELALRPRAINEFTQGYFEKVELSPSTEYIDGILADVFSFGS